MKMQDACDLSLSTTSADAVTAWDNAVLDSLEHRLSAAGHVKSALEADPDFVMALAMRAAMLLQIGSTGVYGKIAETLAHASACAEGATKREQMHVAALELWLAGNQSSACNIWQEIIDQWPADILALRLHHNGSFWTGDAKGLLRAPQGVLKAIGETGPNVNFVKGMVAFGLEESGDYGGGEKFGRQAIEANGNDLWALHAVAHVLEMQGRREEGRALLNQPLGAWSDRNPFKDHLWWHSALFALEQGDTPRVLELYDAEVRVDETGFYLDVQNAASLLRRLELTGADVGTRWEELADLAVSRKGDHVMPFTDMHFMMALTGAGRLEAARSYLASLEEFARTGNNDAAAVMQNVGVRLCEGLLAHGEGRDSDAADILYPMRGDLAPLGASHAQRDVFAQIIIDVVMRAGQTERARALLSEREVLRPGSGWVRERLESLS